MVGLDGKSEQSQISINMPLHSEMPRHDKKPIRAASAAGIAICIGGPVDTTTYKAPTAGRASTNTARRTRCDVHVMVWSNVMLLVRCGVHRDLEKMLAFWKGTAISAPMATEETTAPT